MPDFTRFDPLTRRVMSSGFSAIAPKGAGVLVGVRCDPSRSRMMADLSGVEPKTDADVTLAATTVAPDAPLSITVGQSCRVATEQTDLGTLAAGTTSIRFPDAGTYLLRFIPVEPHLYLAVSRTVTVTGAPAPAPADVTAPELGASLLTRFETLLDRLEVLATNAETGVAFVDEVRARPMATAAELRDAVKDLALAVSRGFEESAEQIRAHRRSVVIVRELLRRSLNG